VARPRLRALAARVATAPRAGVAAAPGVAIWCNDLLEGARHGPAQRSAAAVAAAAILATAASGRRAQVLAALDPAGAAAAPQPGSNGLGYGLQVSDSTTSLA
jgi:hypothetical protein